MSRTVNFPSLQGCWTPLTAARDLRRKPLADVLDGVPVVLFRDQNGTAQALVDRCPHRSVKLSVGKLPGDGTIQCAYHAWRFDGTGACRAIPFNPRANKLSVVHAQALACEERDGLLWLFAGDPADALPLDLPPALSGGWFGSILHYEWDVHWSRAVQTALDVAHLPFVHRTTIGVAFGRKLGKTPNAQISHRMALRSDGGFRMDWWIDGGDDVRPADAGWVEFHPPNGMSLVVSQKGDKQSLLYIYLVPLADGRSRQIIIARRNHSRYSPIPRLFDAFTPMIFREDERNMTTAWPSEVPTTGEEVSMPSDAPSLQFQKWYRAWLNGLQAATR
ncbi:Rieske 2Fe-2S domain-containing protein [Sphingomonas sp. GlSt437]|uniref:Rieske 2Fe-2S domain-containing protein n=2 Tax=Bacteria TaxID=2 RepID=UPI003A87B657